MNDPIEPITSQLLNEAGFRHAFFTRAGGVSTGPYAELNLSNSVGDSSACVAENLRRAAAWLGLDVSKLFFARQIHGSNVVTIERGASLIEVRATEADALIGFESNTACCVQTADCVPILIADAAQGRVAAVHAGWRGIVAQVVARAVEQLHRLGSDPTRLLVAIGPHIRLEAFEVSDDVAEQIARLSPSYSVVQRAWGPLPHVALVESVHYQLRASGVLSANIDDAGGCTFSDGLRFFSYRRQGVASGRHLHAIVPRA